MDISSLKSFKSHAFKLSNALAHSYFLQSCLFFGLTPNSLTIFIPISATPPQARNDVYTFRYLQSLRLTHTMLRHHFSSATTHSIELKRLFATISIAYPHLLTSVHDTLSAAQRSLDRLSETLLNKLSRLCTNFLAKGGSLPFRHPLATPPPLVADKPSIASYLNLPIPSHTPPILPPKFCPPNYDAAPVPTPSKASTPPSTTSVVNLSSHTLTPSESSALAKGLSFSPTPSFNHFRLVADAAAFARQLRWKYFWSTQPNPSNPPSCHPSLTKFQPPSQREPPILPPNHPIERYISRILADISDSQFPTTLSGQPNLTRTEKSSLQSLHNNSKILILPADKGSTTVVIDRADYLAEADRQLSDVSTYQPLPDDPTKQFNEELHCLIETAGPSQGLTKLDISLLLNPRPRTPSLYFLPKIHKPNNPGRPIVSSYSSSTERVSAYIDAHLQPFVKSLPSYIKDTNHFLDLLRSIPTPIPPNTIMATVDVTSLYTNIPHTHGLSALEHFLNLRPPHTLPSTQFLVMLTQFILNHNHFTFNSSHYLQVKGTAMGTRMAPSYANLFMGYLEQEFLENEIDKPGIWLRFIDDIFILWPHGPDSLTSFLESLNSRYPVNFTHTSSTSHVTFLDVDVHLEFGQFRTSVHIKPTNTQQYLHFHSCHPTATKRSIPYSLATRGRRICNYPDDLKSYTDNLTHAFTSRGYPAPLVQKQISRALNPRIPTPKPPPNTNHCSLITTYYPGLHKLKRILREGFHILSSDPCTRNLLEKPPSVTFRKPPNLHQLLTSTNLEPRQPAPPKVSKPCNRPRCKTCDIHNPTNSFTSPTTHISYPITSYADCRSSNVVYQLQCKKCDAFYIGETGRSLSDRMNGHRSTSKVLNPVVPVAIHTQSHQIPFQECWSVQIVHNLPDHTPDNIRRQYETAYQLVLQSRQFPGLNSR